MQINLEKHPDLYYLAEETFYATLDSYDLLYVVNKSGTGYFYNSDEQKLYKHHPIVE